MIVTIDFETFYDKNYSLTKLSEAEYILSPEFEAIMCAVKVGSSPTRVYVGHERITQALTRLDWSRTAVLAHNTRFDGAVLAWRFGIVPAYYLDTLSMARAVTHWHLGKSSLKAVSEFLRLPPKGDEVGRAQGKRLEDFTHDELARYKIYCARDNGNAWEIYAKLKPCFSAGELSLIDLILRMFILPQVKLDPDVLTLHLAEVRRAKADALAQVENLDKSWFASNQRFAWLLEANGVEVPYKSSPQTGEKIPAVARNDWAFKELCADDTQPLIVQALLMARLSVKSTLDETRADNLLKLSKLGWPDHTTGWAPVPLKYSGARTHRLSGDAGVNWQNFRRGSMIRRAVVAPPGYRVVHRDSSQIEARIAAWMAGCKTLLTAFREERDVYSEFASLVYKRTITKADTLERFVGKTGILGLGYGCGNKKFRHVLYIGNGGISVKVDLSEASSIVSRYRNTYPEIPNFWRACNDTLGWMVGLPRTKVALAVKSLPVVIGKDRIWLPSDLSIAYPGLRMSDTGDRQLVYNDAYGGKTKIYGAKLTENLSQAFARIVITDIILRVYQTTGYYPWLSCHDSLDYCVPEQEAEVFDLMLTQEFGMVPSWADGLPLASEGGWGRTLFDAERQANE